ncbi:MAG TPA: hypothetical protein VGD10_11405 [Allosphingosinicella sp.]|uniref:hypothetical protein n=1 Tax=Allosphingosinicella sp. TaxID=2823234 RepID=UPI002ED9E419
MRKLFAAAMLAALPLTPLQAQSMPISQFLAKADALKAKGAMAMFSSDLGLLKKEAGNSGKALRAEQQAAVKAGRKPPYCMPAKAAINSNELLAHLRSIPPAQQRRMSVKDGFASLVRKKYPC